jgi:hypothetical protein
MREFDINRRKDYLIFIFLSSFPKKRVSEELPLWPLWHVHEGVLGWRN